jgi:hypothetical protein
MAFFKQFTRTFQAKMITKKLSKEVTKPFVRGHKKPSKEVSKYFLKSHKKPSKEGLKGDHFDPYLPTIHG